jgi:hypothetical protein
MFRWRWQNLQTQQSYLTLRLVLSLNIPQNSEMKFCEKYKVDILKIIIIIIDYILNNFTYSYHNIIIDDGEIYNFKLKNEFNFWKN